MLIRGSLVIFSDAESASRRGFTFGLRFTAENTNQVVAKKYVKYFIVVEVIRSRSKLSKA